MNIKYLLIDMACNVIELVVKLKLTDKGIGRFSKTYSIDRYVSQQ
ncbi:hypothetical protein GAB14E_3993 [Colwellia psychrerythraea]|uniref:Uncharacterized protein n=1 Tax=Colwellia psychrerythraea TaxID=28229 RepID=A0A099KG68_COLPS|nr:hypothetical protein GAB14E_3993 [Colwellia psychrerythraea]